METDAAVLALLRTAAGHLVDAHGVPGRPAIGFPGKKAPGGLQQTAPRPKFRLTAANSVLASRLSFPISSRTTALLRQISIEINDSRNLTFLDGH
jgi:hypothetical protein